MSPLVGMPEFVSNEIENPFGWDVNDHDLSRFCKTLSNEIDALVKCLGGDFAADANSRTLSKEV